MADDAIVKLTGTGVSTTPASQPPEMTTTDITAEGDVILILQHSCLRVSSAILASASPVFKVMLGPAFLEGQDFRSAQYPKQIPLEDDSTAMTRLCFLLHHKRDPEDPTSHDISLTDGAEGLFALAIVADKYGCADAVRATGSSLLAHFVYSSISTGMLIGSVLNLVGTAYVLEDDRQFALLTRRLVMDHTTRFSRVDGNPAMAALPGSFLCAFSLPEPMKASANDSDSARRGAAKGCKYDASRRSVNDRRQSVCLWELSHRLQQQFPRRVVQETGLALAA